MGQAEQAHRCSSSARSKSTRSSCPALTNLERIYAARGQNNSELVDDPDAQGSVAHEPPSRSSAPSLRLAALYEGTLGDFERARAGVPRSASTSTGQNVAALRGLDARLPDALNRWPDLVQRPRSVSSTSWTTERERIEVLLQAR